MNLSDKTRLEILTYISIIFTIILYTYLSQKNKVLRYIFIIVQFFAVIKLFSMVSNVSKIKQIYIFFGCLLYIFQNDGFISKLYNNFFYFILVINILIMSIFPFLNYNYHLFIQTVLCGLLVPKNFTNLNINNSYYKWFTIFNITTLIIYYIFADNFRSWSLFALITIIPMIFNNWKDPWLYRAFGLGAWQILNAINENYQFTNLDNFNYKFKFFKHSNNVKKYNMASFIIKHNNWRNSLKIIPGLSIYNLIIIINYFVLLKVLHVKFKYNY